MNLKKAVFFLTLFGFINFVGADTAFSQYGSPRLTIRGMINKEILRGSLPKRRVQRTRKKTNRINPAKKITKSKIANRKPTGITVFNIGEPIIPNNYYKTFKGSEAERRRGYLRLKSFWNNYLRLAQKDGFPPNDLAYSLEYYLVTNYIIYSDYWDPKRSSMRRGESKEMYQLRVGNEITIPVEEKIYWQFKSFLSKNGFLTKLSNQDKQMLAESLVVTTAVPLEMYRASYTSRGTQRSQARKMAETNLRNLLGVLPNKLVFFEQGFTLTQ